jgi:hypothetical protein
MAAAFFACVLLRRDKLRLKTLDLDRGSDQLIWACRRNRPNPFTAENRRPR